MHKNAQATTQEQSSHALKTTQDTLRPSNHPVIIRVTLPTTQNNVLATIQNRLVMPYKQPKTP